MATPSLRNVLEKMDNTDSDYRYMATSDLSQQLLNPALRADSETQKKLCRAVMKLLKDTNSEVQGVAMKCLPALADFVDIIHASYIVDKLLDHVLESQAVRPRVGAPENVGVKAMRDVSSLALKAILAKLTPDTQKAAVIARSISPRLVLTIRSTKATGNSVDVLIETFELLNEVLNRMGTLVVDQHGDICDSILRQLPSQSAMITKRGTACIGALASTCDNSLFSGIVAKTIADLQTQESKFAVRTGVQIFWVLSKTAGHRLAIHVQDLAPILFEYSSSEVYAEDDELREHCIQTLGSFCLRCKREMFPFGTTLAKCLVSLAKYDPNYVIDDEDEEQDQDEEGGEGMGEDFEDFGEDFEDDEDYSDDDDMSWKVRRAAVRSINAAISVELLSRAELFEQFGPFLVGRFKEREESVKLDVFAAFSELLRLTGNSARTGALPLSNVQVGSQIDAMAVDADEDIRDDVSPLLTRGPQIMRNLKKELSSRSLKTRTKAMSLLRELVSTMPSVIIPLIGKVIREVEQGLRDSSTAVKTESLLLLRGVVRGGGAEALIDHIAILIPVVLATTDDRYYKVTAECLRCCGETLTAFGTASAACKEKLARFAADIHDSAMRRATAQDQDSEVKEAALHCLGATVSYFGRHLGSQRLSSITAIIVDRLGNEVTRLSTVRALHTISQSEAADVLRPVMGEITETVGGFLRKNNPSLRVASLDMLSVAPALATSCDSALVQNVSELISDSDLRITRMALVLAKRLIEERGSGIIPEILKTNSIYYQVISLTSSPLLQGSAVEALIEFFRIMTKVNSASLSAEAMILDLTRHSESFGTSSSSASVRTSPLHCVAKCIVAVCDATDPVVRGKISERIIHEVASTDRKRRIFSLACLGEFGRSSVNMKTEEQKQSARNSIISALDAQEDDIRTAAALALGGVTAADGASGVPALVDLIKRRPEQRYLLLLSLKDAISSARANDLSQLVHLLLPLLLQPPSFPGGEYSGLAGETGRGKQVSERESVRTATAECLGLLAQASPDVVIAALVEGAASPHTDIRESATAAIKFAVSSNSSNGPALARSLRPVVNIFIQLIGDNDVMVSKSALQAVNAIAKSRPSLLVPHLAAVQHLVFARLKKNKEFIRVVDLGPFKHEEDFGLDMRKSAFDCMRTFVSGPLCSSIQLPTLVEETLVGLGDQSDVRAIAQLILATAAATPAAPQLVTIIEPIVKALEATFNEKVKANAVRQEAERHDESIRGALRAVRMLETIPEITRSRRFQAFMASVVRTSKYMEKYESIGQSDVELMTFGGMTSAGSGLAEGSEDVVMVDK